MLNEKFFKSTLCQEISASTMVSIHSSPLSEHESKIIEESEGWIMILDNEYENDFKIKKSPNNSIFETDLDAYIFVHSKAILGSEIHHKSLIHIKILNPKYYDEICLAAHYKKITFKNTLHTNCHLNHQSELHEIAIKLNYPYYIWNEKVFKVTEDKFEDTGIASSTISF
jgi:hypothetical protein